MRRREPASSLARHGARRSHVLAVAFAASAKCYHPECATELHAGPEPLRALQHRDAVLDLPQQLDRLPIAGRRLCFEPACHFGAAHDFALADAGLPRPQLFDRDVEPVGEQGVFGGDIGRGWRAAWRRRAGDIKTSRSRSEKGWPNGG